MSNHAIAAAWERYGVRLSWRDLQAIVTTCLEGGAVLVKDTGPTRQYLVRHGGAVLLAVISVASRAVVTFLPAGASSEGATKRRGVMVHKGRKTTTPRGSKGKRARRPEGRRKQGREWLEIEDE